MNIKTQKVVEAATLENHAIRETLETNPAILRALKRLKESKSENHVSHYTKHSSHAVRHSSTW